ncbi:uncharacterized protein METZ01_LOCUS221486, partial [marine metagenome]
VLIRASRQKDPVCILNRKGGIIRLALTSVKIILLYAIMVEIFGSNN